MHARCIIKMFFLISVGLTGIKIIDYTVKLVKSTLSGTTRKRKSERIDKDIKRPKTNEDPLSSEAAFKRARRDSVANAVEKGWDQSLAFDLNEDPFHELWGEAHDKEFGFQKKKQTEHMVSAYQEGLLKESEVDQEAVATTLAKERERDKLLVRESKVQKSFADKMHGPMKWENLSGKTVWVASDIQKDELDVALQRFNITKTQERTNADALIVKDAANMPERARLFAAGLGLTVLDACLFDGQQGFKVKFKRACGTPRTFFITAAFKDQHPEFEKNVRSLLNQPLKFSHWKLAKSRQEACIILATKVECQNDSEPNLFCKVSFLDKISRLDSHTSGVYKG